VSTQKIVNVLILNTVALNGGDGAILIALLDGLRERLGPSATFTVHEAQPEVAARYYPSLEFRPTAWTALGSFATSRLGSVRRRVVVRVVMAAARGGLAGWLAERMLSPALRRTLRDYRTADVVITTGGTYLVEHYDLAGRLLSFEIARAARKPLVFYTQSLGPFRRPEVRQAVERILSSAELVFLRDALSRKHVVELGGRTDHVHVVPDCVFSLADAERLATAAKPRPRLVRPLRVAISVRDWAHFTTRDPEDGMRNYIAAVRAATVHLVERHGARVTFLSTCQGIPEYAHDDARTAEKIAGALPTHVREAVIVDDHFREPRRLLEALTDFDLVLSTRMHFAILSLIAGVPVIPISYEFKMRELFGHLGQGTSVHDIEDITPEALVHSIDEMLAHEAEIRSSLFPAVIEASARAASANDELAALVNRRVGRAS
jgi:colanic acid/amylovoran biosynthesis protein